MDIALKYKIVEKIIQSNDEVLLNEIKSLMGLSEGDWWDEVPAGLKQKIKKSKSEHDTGDAVLHAEVMSEIKRRFLNS